MRERIKTAMDAPARVYIQALIFFRFFLLGPQVIQAGVFECLVHAHCGSGLMCAGDGRCTQGVMEVINELDETVSFRTYGSRNCSGGLGVDTWGVSKEQLIPDLLNASGMCSYRSWYEQRQVVANHPYSSSSSYQNVSGSELWNFTAPDRTPAPAFGAGVLRTRAHPCDRDYEHLSTGGSCAPSTSFLLTDGQGQGIATLERVNRTRTYRLPSAPYVPVVRQPMAASSPSVGFLGMSNATSYTALGYDTYLTPGNPSNRPQLCSNLALCGTQAAWRLFYVNGVLQPNRLVANRSSSSYTTSDMMACGGSGYLLTSSTCQIDPQVAPLFFVYCGKTTPSTVLSSPSSTLCTSKYPNQGRYAASQGPAFLSQLASDLNSIAELYRTEIQVVDWASYLTAAQAADSLFSAIQGVRASLPQGANSTGLYYALAYGVYEYPYAWWFRCGFLLNIAPSASVSPCAGWTEIVEGGSGGGGGGGQFGFGNASTSSSSSSSGTPL